MARDFAAQNDLKENIEANSKYPRYGNKQNRKKIPTYLPSQCSKLTPRICLLNSLLYSKTSPNRLSISKRVPSRLGVITFARIGSVRSLPYKLVVMLNLNLSEFPKQEQQNRYNLMQAGLPIRGDRFREDDDLGAFWMRCCAPNQSVLDIL